VLASLFPPVSRETDLPGARLEIGGSNVIYRHVLGGSGQPEEEVWVEVRLDDDWVVTCLIELDDGGPAIAELRVLPYEDDMERIVLLGPNAAFRRPLPSGGVPVEKLRSLRAEDVLGVAREQIAAWPNAVEYLSAVLADFGLG
jgi:hypothetical protein